MGFLEAWNKMEARRANRLAVLRTPVVETVEEEPESFADTIERIQREFSADARPRGKGKPAEMPLNGDMCGRISKLLGGRPQPSNGNFDADRHE